jgi:hypothetical protein
MPCRARQNDLTVISRNGANQDYDTRTGPWTFH